MMTIVKKVLVISAALLFSGACKEAYDPPVLSTDHAYLVVEGFINNGPDSTVITLSHTYTLSDTAQATPEPGATVSVEGSDNSIFALPETGKGQYGADLTTLNPANQYRLHILTSAGKEYRSDFVAFKLSPPIDSINWVRNGDGVQIYANTHDPQKNSTYYLWKYEETWEFHSVYGSEFEYLPAQDTIVTRTQDSFYFCWTGENSTNILLGSSARLASDVIYEAPLLLIPSNSWHISLEYSILVKQYVLTADAYNFWLNLQLNTEQIGSIFSPQPSQIRGNVHSLSDSTEQVLGYISAGTLSKQRIFINPTDIPNWTTNEYPNSCQQINIIGVPDTERLWLASGFYIPTDLDPLVMQPPFPPFRFDIANQPCVDCTQLGVNHKPAFWP
jgi:hypothetical protein